MPNVARYDDANTGGGIIKTIPQSTVFANDKLISVDGSKGTGHPIGIPHSEYVWGTANGSSTVTINNIPVNDQGDADSCLHTRAGGSPDVFTHGS